MTKIDQIFSTMNPDLFEKVPEAKLRNFITQKCDNNLAVREYFAKAHQVCKALTQALIPHHKHVEPYSQIIQDCFDIL